MVEAMMLAIRMCMCVYANIHTQFCYVCTHSVYRIFRMHPISHIPCNSLPLSCMPSAVHSSLGLIDTEVIALPRRGRKWHC